MVERDRRDIEEIEFDFFDETPTREGDGARTAAPPKRRRRRVPTGPPRGGTPLVRLGALVAGLILLAVVLVLSVQSCREDQRKAEYENYMKAVASVGGESAQIGAKLNDLVSTPGKKLSDLRSEIDGLREQQSQTVTRAQALDPPGPLREQQERLVEALQLRVSGLAGLATALGQVSTQKTRATLAGRQLAEQSYRFVASDVVYDDFFKEGARAVLHQEGITGVVVPSSTFLKDGDLATAQSWSLIVKRLSQPAATKGGLHGNQIEGVLAEPGDVALSANTDNTVKGSDRLAFVVLVKNSGQAQEAQVKVNFTIQQSPNPIHKSAVIDLIDPGETERVTFGDIAPSFGTRTIVKVSVEPVVGETNRNNNSAEYPVFFTVA